MGVDDDVVKSTKIQQEQARGEENTVYLTGVGPNFFARVYRRVPERIYLGTRTKFRITFTFTLANY